MQRTLYINENNGLVVKRDGHSLWIEENHMAGRRVPARLINSIVIRGNVKLDAGVITLFAEHGVPVSFLSRDGAVCATVITARPEHSSVKEKMLRLKRDDERRERVREWLCSSRRSLMVAHVRDMLPERLFRIVEDKGLRDADYKECIERNISGADRARASAVAAAIDAFLHGLALKTTLDAGLDPHAGFAHLHGDFGFVRDLCYALAAEKDRQVAGFLKSKSGASCFETAGRNCRLSDQGMKEAVLCFENRKSMVRVELERLIDEFYALLREPLL